MTDTASSLALRTAGALRRNRKAIVLLHGWSCHGGFFYPQLSGLADETLILAPDLPGHGKTANRAGLSIEAAADQIACLLRERDLRDVVLVGWSMGAHVAYSLIERHGTGRLASLVVEDMTARVLNGNGWKLGTSDGTDARRNAEILDSIEPYWPRISGRIASRIFAEGIDPDPDVMAFVVEEIARADPSLLRPMWASLTSQDFRALLSGIDVPVHLVSGARSALYTRDVADWQAERIRDATIHVFPCSGHAPHLEEPERFNDLLLSVASERPGTRPVYRLSTSST